MKGYKKTLTVVVIIAVIVPTLLVLRNRVQSANQSANPKIMCDAHESGTSSWYVHGKEPKYNTVSTVTTFNNFTAWATQWLYNPNTLVDVGGENGSWHVWIRNPLDYGQEGYEYIGYFRQPNSRLEFWGKTVNGDVLILTVHDDGNGHFAYTKDYSEAEYPNFQYYYSEPTFNNIHNDNDFSMQYAIKVYAKLYYEKTETTYYETTYYDPSPTFSSYVDTVELGVHVQNFGNKTLFNVRVEVTYKITSNNWNTVTSENLGVLDLGERKQTWVTLENPILFEWHISNAENTTRWVLDLTNVKITAYGYAEP